MADKEYLIFCDESDRDGKYYSDFYGGLCIGSSQYERVTNRLNTKKRELNLFGEVKWEKVSAHYLAKYVELIEVFFEEVIAGHVKVRIMFRHSAKRAAYLNSNQIELRYFLLYYQFIKHAFGLIHIQPTSDGTRLRIYFDKLPDTKERVEQFKSYLLGMLLNGKYRAASIKIGMADIAEVSSHDHVLLQCLDIVLGSMAFRLNDRHKEKMPGTQRRGKRTVAKEKLYKAIHKQICRIRPRFNIGVSTSWNKNPRADWDSSYRHWEFQPSNAIYDAKRTKGSNKTTKKNPA